MIVGAILETANNAAGSPSSGQNGAALITFYTWNDAINWATLQSEQITYGTGNSPIFTLCSITNTETSELRWWYAGIEYTG
jgi:phenylacetate-coenzyme A ligase PaaK-like adenylate-forming protein